MADRLGVSRDTIQVHKQVLFRKLGVVSSQGAVGLGFRQGLIQ